MHVANHVMWAVIIFHIMFFFQFLPDFRSRNLGQDRNETEYWIGASLVRSVEEVLNQSTLFPGLSYRQSAKTFTSVVLHSYEAHVD